MRNQRHRRSSLVALILALAVVATPAILFAHARLVRSSPSANQTLEAAPTELRLWFSEQPELKLTTVQLADSAGHSVALGQPTAAAQMGVTVPITGALAGGRYTVKWRTAASDGHPSSGSYSFTLKPTPSATPATPAPAAVAPAVVPPTTQPSVIVDTVVPKNRSNAPIGPTQGATFTSAMRWAELVALLTLIGIVVLRLAVMPAAKWTPDLLHDVNDRCVRLARAVLILFALATLTRGFAQAELFPVLNGSRFASLSLLVQSTRWGHAWAIGVCGAVVILLGLVFAGRMTAGWVIAAVGLVAVCMSEALTGHAGAAKHQSIAVASDVAHMLGAGGWLGGLTALLLCALPAIRHFDDEAASEPGSRLLRSFHGSATECVTIVVITAVLSAWVRFPTLDALWTTAYGQMLLRKIFFVVIVAGLGLYHWRRIVLPEWSGDTRARFRRTAIAELVVGAIVVAFTALLISQPLP